MAESRAALSLALVSQGQVVVGIGVPRRKCNGLTISGNGLIRALEFVQYVAQIEERQHVCGVGFGGPAIELLGSAILPQVKLNSS